MAPSYKIAVIQLYAKASVGDPHFAAVCADWEHYIK
jgi:hypothetical protein